MRLYILFLWLTNFLLEVVALNFAAPWEMFYFYSAYKTEWLAGLSGAGRTIATLCVHKDSSLSAGSTYAADVAAAGITDGSTIKPDFDKLLAKFTEAAKKQAARSPFAVDPTKLLPKTTWASKVAYPPIITGIINGFQAARAVIPTISANAALIATEVQSSKEYTQIITQLRTADTEVSKTAVVQGLLAGTPFTMAKQASVTIYKPGVDDLPGKPLASYNHVVDFDQIFAAATTAKQKDRNDLNRAIAKSQKTVEALKEHSNVIESFKSSTELLATDITACVAVRKREILWSLEDAMLGTSGLLQMRDTGIEWRSNDSNQRHLKGLRIMFKEISEATFGVMSRNIFI